MMLIGVPKEIKTEEYRVGALREDVGLRNGLNVHEGKVTCRPVAEALGLSYAAPAEVI